VKLSASVICVLLFAISGEPTSPGSVSVPSLQKTVKSCRDQLFEDPMTYRRAGLSGVVIVVNVLTECDREWQLAVTRAENNTLKLSGVTTTGEGLESQIRAALLGSPGLTAREACGRVTTRTVSERDIDQNRLQGLVNELRRMRVDPMIGAPLVLDGNAYRIWVFAGANHSYFDFYGVPSDPDTPNPLQRWVDDLARLVGLECADSPVFDERPGHARLREQE